MIVWQIKERNQMFEMFDTSSGAKYPMIFVIFSAYHSVPPKVRNNMKKGTKYIHIPERRRTWSNFILNLIEWACAFF